MHRILLFLTLAATAVAAVDPHWIQQAGGTYQEDKTGRIVAVDLRSSWVTDSDLPLLAELPALKQLDLSLTRISDRGLRALRSAPGITELNLYFAEQITDDGLSAIKAWKHLEHLNVRGTKITDTTLEFLSALNSLQSLDIGYAQITDSGLAHLSSLSNLRRLSIGGNKLAGPGLQFLRELPHLTYLDLGGSQRTDSGLWSITLTEAGVDAVANISDLKELRLSGSSVSAASLEALKELKHLESLDLDGCKRIGDDAIPLLSALKLRRLDLHGTGITEAGKQKLQRVVPASTRE